MLDFLPEETIKNGCFYFACLRIISFLKGQNQPQKEILKMINAAVQRDFQPMTCMLCQVVLSTVKSKK